MLPGVRTAILTSWTPAKLNPLLWVEARRHEKCFQTITGTTAVTDTSVCGTIQDISPNGNGLAARGNDTTRPTWNGGEFPYLNFDGSNDLMQTAASLGLYADTVGASVFIALRPTGTQDVGDTVASEANAASNAAAAQYVGVDATTASSSRFFWRDDVGGTNSGIPATGVYTDAVPVVYGYVDRITTGNGFLNGVKQTAVSPSRPGGAMTITTFGVGGLARATPSAWFTGRIYSIVVVKRPLEDREARRLSKYLGKTCGLNL